jgi:CRP-like cAMP-binding protein
MLHTCDPGVFIKVQIDQKQRLVSLAVRRVLERDKTLVWQGDPCAKMFLIASGRLRAVIRSADGRSYVVSTWEKGDEFWAHGLFDGESMPSTLEAIQESIIYQWEGESVLGSGLLNP